MSNQAKIEFIREQIKWVDQNTDNLIHDLKEEDCLIIDPLKTSINWQIGHILVSKYFHTIQSIWTNDHKIVQNCQKGIPFDKLMTHYFAGSNPLSIWIDRPSKSALLNVKEQVDLATEQTLAELSISDLDRPTEINNPVAKTKYEALTFSFKHQMWHNGQIAIMKRIIRS